MKEIFQWIYDNYGITILIVITLLALFVVVTIKVFFNPVDIPTGTVAAYGTFFALISTTIGLWQWRRSRDKGSKSDDGNSE